MKRSWFRRGALSAAMVVVGLTVPLSLAVAAPAVWGDPTALGGVRPSTYGGNAAVVVSADGTRALAVWEGPDKSVQTASATISGTVETWGDVTTLTNRGRGLLNGGFDTELSIALSDDGSTAIAVWAESDSSYANIQISAASASITGTTATWSTVTSVSGPQVSDPNKVMYPQIKISADGTKATAVWLRYDYSNMSLESASAAISGGTATWSSKSVIDGPYYPTTPYTYTDPSLDLSADGTKATVVWANGQDSQYATVKSASATIGGTPANSASWSAPQSLTVSIKKVQSVTVAVSADGTKALATWRMENSDTGIRSIRSAAATISGNTATWGSVIPVDDGVYDANDIHVALSSDGTKATVVWRASYNEEGSEGVKSASGTVSGTSVTWGSTTLLSTPVAGSQTFYPGLELSTDGTVAFVFWTMQQASGFACHEAWATVDGTSATWDPESVVGPGTGFVPQVWRASLSDDGTRATSICGAFDTSTNDWSYSSRSLVWERDGGGDGDGGGGDGGGGGDTLPPSLPPTGSNTSSPLVPVALVLIGGAALLAARRRPGSSRV